MRFLRHVATVAVVLLVLSIAGAAVCENCGGVFPGTGKFCADCVRILDTQRNQAARELVYVENVVKARQQYEKALDELIDYYQKEGDRPKEEDARRERQDFANAKKYDYVFLADLVSPDLSPKRDIGEANTLYADGLRAFNERVYFWNGRSDKYERAARKFEDLIRRFPESDKIDDAAYHLGRCYEAGGTTQDYRRAIVWYQRAYQWNPRTEFDPRFRIAEVYEDGLHERDRAIAFYTLEVRDGGDSSRAAKAQRRIDALKAKIDRERRVSVPVQDRMRRPE
jgi:TolA-binding protein